jgi:hypothetical protein
MNHADEDHLYQRAKGLFLRALHVAADERQEFLEQECQGDSALMLRVHELLDHHDESDDILLQAESLRAHALERMVGQHVHLGEYELLEIIGRGGMGVVYRARNKSGKEVALKIIAPLGVSRERRQRFVREATVLQRLHHPGICRLLESGQVDAPGGALDYFSMELVEGVSLRDHLALARPDRAERLQLLDALLDAVEHAHEQNITHRDIKPENVLIRSDGSPVLLDFGIAHLTGYRSTTALQTQTGSMMGTLRYMSPEQARGEHVNESSDVYSLGVLAHEILTGELPYRTRSRSETALLLEIASSRMADVLPDLTRNVRSWLAVALEKNPIRRYANAGDMRSDLAKVIAGQHVPGTRRRWLRKQARRFLWRQGMIPIALAIVASTAVTIVLAERDRGRQAERQTRLHALNEESRMVTLIESADRRIHRGSRTQDGLKQAIHELDAARLALGSLADRPYTSQVRRFIDWRAGEANYFLGMMTHDLKWLKEADSKWASADHYRDETGSLDTLPATGDLRRNIRFLGAHHPPSGRGLAHAAMAAHRRPLQNWQSAARYFRKALQEWAARWNQRDDPFDTPKINPLIVHDLGSATVHWGIVADSLALVEQGLAILKRVDSDSLWSDTRDAEAAYRSSMATAYLARWRAFGKSTDLDAAEACLQRSALLRNPLDGNINYIYTMHDLCTVHIERSRSRRDPAEQETCLRAAFDAIQAARGRIQGLGLGFETAELRLAEADLWLCAARQGKRLQVAPDAALRHTAALLDEAERTFERSLYPLQWAFVQEARIRWCEVSFLRDHQTAELDHAEELLRNARSVVPAPEHRRLARLLEDHARTIRDLRTEPQP